MMVTVRLARADDPALAPLIAAHHAHCGDICSSNHVLSLRELQAPDIRLFAAYDGDTPVGIGAIRDLGDAHGEIKSMHTDAAARGKGVARAILTALLNEARRKQMARVSLETGTVDDFAAARAFYERAGFAPCPPFARYTQDPASAYYTCALRARA